MVHLMFGVLRDQRTLHVLFPVASLQCEREWLRCKMYNRENVQSICNSIGTKKNTGLEFIYQ